MSERQYLRSEGSLALFLPINHSFRTVLAMVRKGKDAATPVEEHVGGGHITVTAQQSRYALDAIDAPASKEVRIDTCTNQSLYIVLIKVDSGQRSINQCRKP